MSILFSRSIRSLDNDNGVVGMIVGTSMVIIVLAWLVWFFFAQVPVYETSRDFTVSRDGRLIIPVSPDALTRIQPGQEAVFLPAVSADSLGKSLPALVMDTPGRTGRRDNTVEVYVDTPVDFSSETAGEVRIIVDHVSPFALLLQSTR